MLRSLTALFVVAAIVGANITASEPLEGKYTIVGVPFIQLNSAYHVAVSVHNASESSTMRLTIENGADFKMQQEVVVQPWSTETVTFRFGVLPPPANGSRYKLIAEGLQGIQFRNETWLHVTNKEFNFLVQSDKTMYKQGDLVRFRVLVIDDETKPVELRNELQLYLEDGASNRVKQWTNQTTLHGVFSGEFRLSESPAFGSWKLVAEARNESTTHSIEVAEYVLPTFETFIQTADNVLVRSGKINVNVLGKHPSGKPVHGEATVTARGQCQVTKTLEVRKVINVTTESVVVEFDLVDELKLSQESDGCTVDIDVSLVEELTGHRHDVSKSVTVHRREFSITREWDSSYNYVEGYPKEIALQLKRFDGSSVANEELELRYSTDFLIPEETHSVKRTVDNEGKVTFVLTFPLKRSGFFLIAWHKDMWEGLGYVPSTPYFEDQCLDFYVSSSSTVNSEIGETVTVDLQSREALHFYTYQLIGRGDVLLSKTVRPDNVTQQKFEFQFDLTQKMFPVVQVFVYTVRENGKTEYSQTFISPKPSLASSITLQSSVNETKAGDDVELKIVTPQKSFVGLLAIDRRLFQLRSGKDLNVDDVIGRLYDFGNIFTHQAFGERYRFVLGDFNAKVSAFENNGLFVLSNVDDLIPEVMAKNNQNDTSKNESEGVAAEETDHNRRVQTIWTDYPDTWIWDNLVVDSDDGVISLHKKVPDTITSWVITAFSLSPEHGLALTSEPVNLTVTNNKPFLPDAQQNPRWKV